MNRSDILCSVFLAAIISSAQLVAAGEQSSGPKDPASPSAEFDNRQGGRESWVRASLVRAAGDSFDGELLVSFPSLELMPDGTTGAKTRTVTLAEITSIEFTRWRGRVRRKNEYAFYPVRMRVTLADRSVIESAVSNRELYRLRLRTGDRMRAHFSYFFDYRDRDAWKNSGVKDMAYPETNPHGHTVVRIHFMHESESGPLDLFLKYMKR